MSTPISDPNGTDNQPNAYEEARALGLDHALAKMRQNIIPDLSMCVIAEAFDYIVSRNKRAEISVSEGEQQDLGEKEPSADHVNAVLQKALSDPSGHSFDCAHCNRRHDLSRELKAIINEQRCSVSLIQRRFRFGYVHALEICRQLEARGFIRFTEGGQGKCELTKKLLLSEQDGKAGALPVSPNHEKGKPCAKHNTFPKPDEPCWQCVVESIPASPSLPASKAGEETEHFPNDWMNQTPHVKAVLEQEPPDRLRQLAEIATDEIWTTSGISRAEVYHFILAALQDASGLTEADVTADRVAIQKALKECPWPVDVWPTTASDAGKFLRERLHDNDVTAVAGTLMRHGWQCAEEQVKRVLSEQAPNTPCGSGFSPNLSAPARVEAGDNKALEEKQGLEEPRA